MLRRSGDHIVLPDRVDLKMYISFNEQEMQMYHEAKEKALEFINDVLNNQNVKGGYKNAIHKINHLRLICNHGLWQPNGGCVERKLETEGDSAVEWWSSTAAHKALGQFSSMGIPMTCIECNSLVNVNMPNFDARLLEPMPSVKAHLTRCLQLWCTPCYSLRETHPQPFALCNCDTECPIATVQLDALSRSPSPFAVDVNRHHGLQDYPTKIRALLDDVQRIPTSTKR
jgi:SWI/SNF-related matrix-associated actin-dependent regulator of chromatin subfamily A3